MDAFAWQIAASVAIPGFTIHQICHYSGKGIQTVLPKIPKGPRYTKDHRYKMICKIYGFENIFQRIFRQYMVSAIGLGAIPFIIHPIDRAVDWMFDSFPRKYLYTL